LQEEFSVETTSEFSVGVPPDEAEPAYRLPPPELELETIICFKHTRKVARDNTVKYRWRTLRILPEPGTPSYAGVTSPGTLGRKPRALLQRSGALYARGAPTSGSPQGTQQLLCQERHYCPWYERHGACRSKCRGWLCTGHRSRPPYPSTLRKKLLY
jgi:hypothetical protein